MRILAPLTLSVLLAATAARADPRPEFQRDVAQRLAHYGLHVDPASLNTARTGALWMLLTSERGYLNVRRKARNILTNPAFGQVPQR